MFTTATIGLMMLRAAAGAMAQTTYPLGVLATGTMGLTNPPEPTSPTAVNQSSMARLLTINSIDDFCIFAPPFLANISITETEEVAYCTKPRNNARVIPDGTLSGVLFITTSSYKQIMGYGNFTQLNIMQGDEGGELDPHGATGAGNPMGGNLTTSDPNGKVLNIAEWMQYISYNQFCIRACTNATPQWSAAQMCWHELDEMGCEWVMPGLYDFNGTFETCEGDPGVPPGQYPITTDGSTSWSLFAQRWTGVVDGTSMTIGDTLTPSAPYTTPSMSSCVTTSSVSNGIPLSLLGFPTASSGSALIVPLGGSASPSPTATSGALTSETGSVTQPTGKSNASTRTADGRTYGIVWIMVMLSWMGAVMVFH